MAVPVVNGGGFEEDVIDLCSDDENNIPSSSPKSLSLPPSSETMQSISTKPASGDASDSCDKDYSYNLFNEFLLCCKQHMEEKDLKILDKVKNLWSGIDPSYTNSRAFHTVLETAKSKIVNNVQNLFVHIHEVYSELKAQKPKRKITSSSSASAAVTNGSVSNESDEESRKHERQIRKLERILRKWDRRIKFLENKELDLNDLNDEDSDYVMADKCKKKFMETWRKLCELKKVAPRTGRPVEKKFFYEGSRYPEINGAVSSFINKKKIFPDYTNIKKIIHEVSEKVSLGFSSGEIEYMAKDTFAQVGQQLKERRQYDNMELLQYYGYDAANDPAKDDDDWQKTLHTNYEEGQKNIDQVLENFTQEQLKMKLEPQEVSNSEESERSENDEEPDHDIRPSHVKKSNDLDDDRETEGFESDEHSLSVKECEKIDQKLSASPNVSPSLNSDTSESFHNSSSSLEQCSKRKVEEAISDTTTKKLCLSENKTSQTKKSDVSHSDRISTSRHNFPAKENSKKQESIEIIILD